MYPRLVEVLEPAARHVTKPYASNVIEADHGRLKARLRASGPTISAKHAFVQNLRRGHYAITVELPVRDRARMAFDQLALCL